MGAPTEDLTPQKQNNSRYSQILDISEFSRNEYHIARHWYLAWFIRIPPSEAGKWSIPEPQIDRGFKHYMAANVVPHYVMDLVRENNERLNAALEKKEKTEPTSWWDLAKALLLFPGGFLIPYYLVILFRDFN